MVFHNYPTKLPYLNPLYKPVYDHRTSLTSYKLPLYLYVYQLRIVQLSSIAQFIYTCVRPKT